MISKDNFWDSTKAIFERCAAPSTEPDAKSENGSAYWFTDSGVVRLSDHWGQVQKCIWIIPFNAKENPKTPIYGFCKWENFVEIEHTYSIDLSESGYNTDRNLCINPRTLREALKDRTLSDTANGMLLHALTIDLFGESYQFKVFNRIQCLSIYAVTKRNFWVKERRSGKIYLVQKEYGSQKEVKATKVTYTLLNEKKIVEYLGNFKGTDYGGIQQKIKCTDTAIRQKVITKTGERI